MGNQRRSHHRTECGIHERPKQTGIRDERGNHRKIGARLPGNLSRASRGEYVGAVHDTNILANSRIPVISFHGDADGIVPYGYGQPFLKLLASSLTSEMKNQLHRFLSEQANPSEHRDGALEDLPVTISVWGPMAEKV